MGPGSIVNDASFAKAGTANGGITPGTIVAAFGLNLASGAQLALSVPLSTNINGTSLTFTANGNNYPAPLFFVSGGQINAQVPFDLPLTGVTAFATFNGQSTTPIDIGMAQVGPGIFTAGDTTFGAILHNNDFTLVSTSNPAVAGEFVLIYCTGLGPLSPGLASGKPAPGAEPLPRTTIQPVVNVGTTTANPVYSGVAPTFVGLFQVAIQVPTLPSGNQPVSITSAGITSNVVMMPVK